MASVAIAGPFTQWSNPFVDRTAPSSELQELLVFPHERGGWRRQIGAPMTRRYTAAYIAQ
jgi:hypothetical protein